MERRVEFMILEFIGRVLLNVLKAMVWLVVPASVCTGTGETDIIGVWAGCKSISCVCQGSS